MLYDPRWEVHKIKPAVLSVAGLVAWLEKQDPNITYNYVSIYDCLLTRYFKAQGYRWCFCGVGQFSYSRFFLPPLFRKFYPHEMDIVAAHGGRTYGRALEFARSML